ncbi:MAG: cystathionine beta-lyase [Proteobacteria bacterium]|nr:cystathionine beta-lyase [Pseudomonadota bacterium]
MNKNRGEEPDIGATRPDTRLVTGGRDPQSFHGFVNPPVVHASTVLYPTAEDFLAHRARYVYGRRGTPTSEAFEEALRAIEGKLCAGVALVPSGLAAVTVALLSTLNAGDHVLVTDSVYLPTRKFCDGVLPRFGISTTYYDPLVGGAVAGLMRPNTRAVFVESPGSLSFEIQDIPAISRAAHARDAVVIMDNTWATPLYFDALAKGVDLSIQAATKYIGGHSDLMLGTLSANSGVWPRVKETVGALGLCAGPDDLYLGLRGLRTMSVRLARHQESGLYIARWLAARAEVLHVMHPGLETHPGHELFRRDFTGASGLFSVVLRPVPVAAAHAFLNTLTLFGIGASWGGYESLAIPFDCGAFRTATRWAPGGPTIRIHVGLEDVADLIADLECGFAALAAVS